MSGRIDRTVGRPRAPDLQVYRPTLTMVMSIVHRATGVASYFGFALFVWWLLAVAAGPSAYAGQQWFMGTIAGQVILFGLTWALLHHSFGGIRHLIHDAGRAHDLPWREYLARASLAGSLAGTVLLWIIGHSIL